MLLYKFVLQTGLGIGMGMNGTVLYEKVLAKVPGAARPGQAEEALGLLLSLLLVLLLSLLLSLLLWTITIIIIIIIIDVSIIIIIIMCF